MMNLTHSAFCGQAMNLYLYLTVYEGYKKAFSRQSSLFMYIQPAIRRTARECHR